MRSRYRVNDPNAAHFITSTVIEWIPVFTSAERCDLLVEAFRAVLINPFLFAEAARAVELRCPLGAVLEYSPERAPCSPTHGALIETEILFEKCSKFSQQQKGLQVHGWVIMPNHFHAIVSAPDLSGMIGDIKKFTARRILQQLEETQCDWLLNQLAYFKARHKLSHHQVWQEGFHPQDIIGDEMMLQKLDYLHNNPVRAGFVASPEHWRYSSAHEWMPGALPVLPCDDWR